MRIFMLGWEFPPYISGGLGTACYGLTRALSKTGHEITFVLPRAVPNHAESHVRLRGPRRVRRPEIPLDHYGSDLPDATDAKAEVDAALAEELAAKVPRVTTTPSLEPTALHEPARRKPAEEAFEHVTFVEVPCRLSSPYHSGRGTAFMQRSSQSAASEATTRRSFESQPGAAGATGSDGTDTAIAAADEQVAQTATEPVSVLDAPMHERVEPAPYSFDLLAETQRYAAFCVAAAGGDDFDVIHCHDWMTLPAATAIAAVTGKPMIAHIHSTEVNRSGEGVNPQVFEIERRGLRAATRVIAVSKLLAGILEKSYGVNRAKIDVIYNGIDDTAPPRADQRWPGRNGERTVLFLGRITMQKGPEYFVTAAKKVLSRMENVRFVMAGSGDLIRQTIELAAREGIGHKVFFTGFLRGEEVDCVFASADVFVMPSVSEPFGITALEAMRHDVPVIISRTSGVSEVVKHALKVDFWDVDQIADRIIAVLRHPPLASALREHADEEIRGLTWADAAHACARVYETANECR